MSDIKVYTANVNDLWEIPSDEVGMANASHFVKFRDFHELTKENAQLKADKAELLAFIQSMPDDIADIFEWHEANNFFVDELIDKHKEQSNEQ